MKTNLILILIFCSLFSFSQEYDINIFGRMNKPTKISLYTGVNMGYQEMNDNRLENNTETVTLGMSIGVLLNNKFGIGIFGYGNMESLINPYNTNIYYSPPVNEEYVKYTVWGMFMEWKVFNDFPIHPVVSVKSGRGTNLYCVNNFGNYVYNSDFFYVIEPEVGLELNIVRGFKISGTIGNRYTNVPLNMLDGLVYHLNLNFIFGQTNNYCK